MSQTIEKQIHLTPERAERLEHLARQRGASGDVLIERALDLLFRLSGDDSYGSDGSPDAERRAWHSMGAKALDRVWDNEADAVYDNWRELYGVPDR